MIINKQNLLVSLAIGKDKSQPVLATVHVTEDGATIACNGKAIMAIEGVSKEKSEAIPFAGHGAPLTGSFTLPLELVNKVLKGIPADKQFDGLLEMIHINNGEKEGQIKITSHDGKSEKLLHGATYSKQFVDYQAIVNLLYFSKDVKAKIIIDRKRLIALLQAFDKVCGDAPVFIEITEDDDLLLRSFTADSEQRVTAFVAGVKADWEETDDFTKSLSGRKKKRSAIKRKKPLRRRKK